MNILTENDIRMIDYDDDSIVLRIHGLQSTDYLEFKKQIIDSQTKVTRSQTS